MNLHGHPFMLCLTTILGLAFGLAALGIWAAHGWAEYVLAGLGFLAGLVLGNWFWHGNP